MPKRNPEIDSYIAKSAEFAKPILIHLRELAHAACPKVEETLKWGMPHFLHKGILFAMAGFKHHCTLHFWKGKLVLGDHFQAGGFGQFGRLTALSDLPSRKVLLDYMRKAVEFNEAGIEKPASIRTKKRLVIPTDLAVALNKNKKARSTFENFSYSHKKEYLDWIAEAKREETRSKRIKTTIQWLAQGKSRNWNYADG